jgi:GR25 family glycosyltransferase involved in LPS biosynthesis
MKAYVLHLGEEKLTETIRLLVENGWDVKPFKGFDNKGKIHLKTNHTYDLDHPGSNYKIGPSSVGNILAHWVLWRAFEAFGKDDYYHVMEDDIRLRHGWQENYETAMKSVPDDWDMIYPGNCCILESHQPHIKDNVYEGCPLCTHWYIVRRKALRTLIDTNSSAWGPIDIQINQRSAPKLKIYSILPRLADQHNTEI